MIVRDHYFFYFANLINFFNFHRAIRYEPGFSFGICVPAACKVEDLRIIIDELVNKRTTEITIKIPENVCQTEKESTKLETVDVIAM